MNVPRIRFKGFNDEWKTSGFNSLFCFLRNNSLSRANLTTEGDVINIHYGDVLIKYGDVAYMDMLQSQYIANTELAKSLFISCPLKDGDIIIADAAEDSTVGKCTEIRGLRHRKAVSGLHTIPCRPIYEMASGYMGCYINSNSYHNQLLPLIQGTKISSISKLALSQTALSMPSSAKEQQSIAQYFRNLDSLIQTTEKKIASLKQVKEASLQTMFPVEGETVPKVRFKGFDGEWEVEQASTIFKTYNERNHPELPVLSAFQDIRGMAIRTDNGYEISHDKRNEVTYKVVRPGQFVMHLRSFQGGFAHSAVTGITSPAYTILGFKTPSMHNDYFWKIVFMSQIFINRLKTITYGIRDGRSISFQEFERLSFLVPNVKEQDKIAEFIHRLNDKVELEELRLKKLKQIKSACLDAMFV